jgi:riboflavin biosynthesis pyrimidine reductase
MAGRSVGLPLEALWSAPAEAAAESSGAAESRAAAEWRGSRLPEALAARFDGDLSVALRPDRPTIVANFVTTVDGIVALGPSEPSAGGGEISGFSESDRFMMALLRGLADMVLVGAGTVRAGRNHEWTPRRVAPDFVDAFAAMRSKLGLAPQPTTVVVTARGDVDPTHRGLSAPDVPVIVVTTRAGAARLAGLSLPANMSVEIAGEGGSDKAGPGVSPQAVLDILRAAGARLVLCEGGPHLFGDLLAARLIDELFLTLAPQIIGRDDAARRFALVEGVSFGAPGRWASLAAVHRAGDDLFLRYRFVP